MDKSIEISLVLKKAIKSIVRLSCFKEINEIFDNLVVEVNKNLKCDRSIVFLLDKNKNELWTKNYIGPNKRLALPNEPSIAGSACSNDGIINI